MLINKNAQICHLDWPQLDRKHALVAFYTQARHFESLERPQWNFLHVMTL